MYAFRVYYPGRKIIPKISIQLKVNDNFLYSLYERIYFRFIDSSTLISKKKILLILAKNVGYKYLFVTDRTQYLQHFVR